MQYSKIIGSVCALGSCFTLIGNAAQGQSSGWENSQRMPTSSHDFSYQTPRGINIYPNPVNIGPGPLNPELDVGGGSGPVFWANPVNVGPGPFNPTLSSDYGYRLSEDQKQAMNSMWPMSNYQSVPSNYGYYFSGQGFQYQPTPNATLYPNPVNLGSGPFRPGYGMPSYQTQDNAFMRRME